MSGMGGLAYSNWDIPYNAFCWFHLFFPIFLIMVNFLYTNYKKLNVIFIKCV
jgi:hypothetical protein